MQVRKTLLSLFLMVLVGILLFTFSTCKKKSDENPLLPPTTVIDIDGNIYHTVTIGTQIWMVENLKVTHYRNGDPIPNVTDSTQWANLTTGACCWYNNDETNKPTYGALYNWYALSDSRKIAPIGWHIPSDAEWNILTDYLGGAKIAGGKMKETDTTHWSSPNIAASNSSGFTALPDGYRLYALGFVDITKGVIFWSSTENSSTNAWYRYILYCFEDVSRSLFSKKDGFSARCLMD